MATGQMGNRTDGLTSKVTVATPMSRYGNVLASIDADRSGRPFREKGADIHIDPGGGLNAHLLISGEGPEVIVIVDGNFSHQVGSAKKPLHSNSNSIST